jgi:hypothetical protein
MATLMACAEIEAELDDEDECSLVPARPPDEAVKASAEATKRPLSPRLFHAH